MTDDVEVVISWRPGCPHRERALQWVLRRWNDTPWKVTLHGADDGQSWNRAHDVSPMVEQSTAGIVICADADVWCEGVGDAVAAVSDGAAWAVPHLNVHRLTEAATARVLAGRAVEKQTDFTERPYHGHPAGTLFVIPRETYLDCPLDPRFVGWGQEDDALALALDLLHGKHWRGTANLYHLWHPPQPRRSRGIGNQRNLELYRRYKIARSDPDRMRTLVDQARSVTV